MELYDEERRQLAEEYNRQKKYNNIYSVIIKLLLLVGFFVLSLEYKFYDFITNFINNRELQLIFYILLLYLLFTVIDSLLSYFLSYKLSYQYDLTKQSTGSWLGDQMKSFLLNLIVLYPGARIFMFLKEGWPAIWWLYFSVIASIFIVILTFLVPVVILPLFFKLEPYPEGSLKDKIRKLIKKAGIAFDEIYEINLSTRINYANAAVMGLGQTRKIVLGDKLKEKYSEEEIEAVMAHEIGHHVHHDIFNNIFIRCLLVLLSSYIIHHLWPVIIDLWGYSGVTAIYSLPLLFIVWGFIFWFFKPFQLYYDRHRERKADEFARKIIEDQRAFACGLAKLADESLSELNYSWYELLFKASHPPIGERVEACLEK